MREPTVAEQMESMLDVLLEAVQDEDDDNSYAPACAAEALAETLRESGMGVAALSWAMVARGLREDETTVREFRAMTRRTLEKLAATER